MDWREGFNTDSDFRQRVEAHIQNTLALSKAKGLSKYGMDFVGDPLQHALEEALDLARYLATEIELRAWIRARRKDDAD